MRGILSIVKTDLILITRNKIALYMALAPVLLACAYLAVLGDASGGAITFAVPADSSPATVSQLQRLAQVEQLVDAAQVQQRVSALDSVAGVVWADGQPTLLLEGNEPSGFDRLATSLLQRALVGDIPSCLAERVDARGGLAAELTAVSLLLTAVFISGAVSGFSLVAERESRAMRALAVAPLTFTGLALARLLVALSLALLNTGLTALVLGRADLLPELLAATLASAGVVALVALALGYSANNQISAIAALKLLMPVALVFPLSSLFVARRWHWLYYWLPHYWQLRALRVAWVGSYDWLSLGMALTTGLAWLLFIRRPVQRRFGLR